MNALSIGLAPALAPAIYEGDNMGNYQRAASVLYSRARTPVLHLHTIPGPKSGAIIDRARKEFPGIRLWFGIPGNHLVDDGGEALAAKYAKRAREFGAELIVNNAEGPNSPDALGWKENAGRKKMTMEQLHARAVAVTAGFASELGDSLILGFTSHDMPDGHKLPWQGFLGEKAATKVHLPQQYGAPERSRAEKAVPARATYNDVIGRMDRSDAQWRSQVTKGRVRPDLAPGSTTGGFGLYYQLHDLNLMAACAQIDRADLTAGWVLNRTAGQSDRSTFPLCDDVGLRALLVMSAIHHAVGPNKGAIRRFQAAKSLTVDGKVGDKTLAALGL